MSDEVFLTGATGFVGAHVLDRLLAGGYRVRALVRGGAERLPARDGCTAVGGDVRDSGALVTHMRGCRYLVHTAAVYSFTPRQRAEVLDVNVRGTRSLLEAAHIAGVERAVVTSSSAAVGPARNGHPATEEQWADAHSGSSAYHRSKVLQERAALRARVSVTTVLPTAPVGPGDHRPTPTGRMVLDVMRGRMWGTLGGGMNVVSVEDAAAAHVLALERGEPGERYIAGGVNLSLAELWRVIAVAAGRRAPRLRIPYAIALAAGGVDEARARLTGAEPRVPLEGVRMGHVRMYVSSDKAQRELGYRPTPIVPAIERAVAWYRTHGYA
ncbi:MAG: NAD-dependent epimerase/dehydratase family protein [Candidatus Dormibacteraeota bacterium]|nr:NAD-dependent epimerase/dehydratase family protein [Candidatus Dormibacteraeota bacterium]MBV9526396.1 NAD-dependent epimerase/dehydratase family protein [Candidatus Dormibacteraeota bacterium]